MLSKSNNQINENQTAGIVYKRYSSKSPRWRYFLRSTLDFLGWKQPMEYCAAEKRCQFEANVLRLWRELNFSVPKVIRVEPQQITLERINALQMKQVLSQGYAHKAKRTLFKEVAARHEVALRLNQPLLCHPDANMRNILFLDDVIYHVDFEMGRPWEGVERWAAREISKMLICLLEITPKEERKQTLILFKQLYPHDRILTLLKKQLFNRSFQAWHDYRAKRKKKVQTERVTLYEIGEQL